MLKAILIDDESRARRSLNELLTGFCEGVEVIGEAPNADEAFEMILERKPDVIFLDIQMPQQTGFDLLKRFDTFSFHVIITTAYDQYMLEAIRHNAFDYLLKPIDLDDLRAALERVRTAKAPPDIGRILQEISGSIASRTGFPKISVPTSDGLIFLKPEEIIHCEADGSYTHIYLASREKITSSNSLRKYEDLLPDELFFRVHNSHLVNLEAIRKFSRNDGGFVELIDGSTVEVSRRRKALLLERLI